MADDMAIAVTTKENAIKDTFYKMLSTHLDWLFQVSCISLCAHRRLYDCMP